MGQARGDSAVRLLSVFCYWLLGLCDGLQQTDAAMPDAGYLGGCRRATTRLAWRPTRRCCDMPGGRPKGSKNTSKSQRPGPKSRRETRRNVADSSSTRAR